MNLPPQRAHAWALQARSPSQIFQEYLERCPTQIEVRTDALWLKYLAECKSDLAAGVFQVKIQVVLCRVGRWWDQGSCSEMNQLAQHSKGIVRPMMEWNLTRESDRFFGAIQSDRPWNLDYREIAQQHTKNHQSLLVSGLWPAQVHSHEDQPTRTWNWKVIIYWYAQ